MMDKNALYKRAVDWAKKHPPHNKKHVGYTEMVFRKVLFEANLENGENLLTQICAQYTGREEKGVDEVHWDKPEWRIPYSNTYRYSPDGSVDCSSWCYIDAQIFFKKNIGTTTLNFYRMNKTKKIPWDQRRIGDIVQWKFKEDRPVSHEGIIVVEPDKKTGKGGKICHTTSPKNPLRFEDDGYAADHRVGVFRILTDEEYQSLFVTDHKEAPKPKPVPLLKVGMNNNPDVKVLQKALNKFGYDLVVDGDFGIKTLKAVRDFQTKHKLEVDGIVGPETRKALNI